MKPRIKKERSFIFSSVVWFCRGGGAMGVGDTPRHAYYSWKWYLDYRAARVAAAMAPEEER